MFEFQLESLKIVVQIFFSILHLPDNFVYYKTIENEMEKKKKFEDGQLAGLRIFFPVRRRKI